jgi:4-hydroxythreonine-4-phosphate dehydrogenase
MSASGERALIAVTTGEPAGIGPGLCARLPERTWAADLVLIGDHPLIESRSAAAGRPVKLPAYAPDRPPPAAVSVWHHPLARPAVAGELDSANARYVLSTLDSAIDGCVAGLFAGMATAPVHKGIVNDAGVPFTGHTEYLEARTGAPRVVMLLVGGGLRVALATTHLPLARVAGAITRAGLVETLSVVDADLRWRFGIAEPRIAVCGLNPHAGEGGHLGTEEIDVIAPAIADVRLLGINATGPLPADTVFVPDQAAHFDCVLAMYHDQGLPVLKHASFGGGVNVTLGLPIVRTSVDHGTALDLAGTGRADPGSLFAAVALAIELATASRAVAPG